MRKVLLAGEEEPYGRVGVTGVVNDLEGTGGLLPGAPHLGLDLHVGDVGLILHVQIVKTVRCVPDPRVRRPSLTHTVPVNLRTSTYESSSYGISITMPYWDERVVEKAKQFEDVKVEKYHIDILCAHFVAKPQRLSLGQSLIYIMLMHLYQALMLWWADILSDLGPAITGTIETAPSGKD
ncbi:hypothetical protein K439DRAFT_1620827 [Ramaria rubella]|nr:hypothetical protein K439DRAFT_1620827 [Ramaria rubella]